MLDQKRTRLERGCDATLATSMTGGVESNVRVNSASASRALKRSMKNSTPPRRNTPSDVFGMLKKREPTITASNSTPPHFAAVHVSTIFSNKSWGLHTERLGVAFEDQGLAMGEYPDLFPERQRIVFGLGGARLRVSSLLHHAI